MAKTAKSTSLNQSMIGKRYGRLTVIREISERKNGAVCFLCKCDCGNETQVRGSDLRANQTKSCGCLRKERLLKHGKHNERLYGIWKSIRVRCNDKNYRDYHYYGGRGIKVCKEWDDYKAFRDWALSNGYNPSAAHGKCTIDRIDCNGDYEPSNCRWVDMKTQRINQRRMKKSEVNK